MDKPRRSDAGGDGGMYNNPEGSLARMSRFGRDPGAGDDARPKAAGLLGDARVGEGGGKPPQLDVAGGQTPWLGCCGAAMRPGPIDPGGNIPNGPLERGIATE
mmetsp:Transcript_23072/g.66893  ORF Transcript_23072/g.66893 Transcript_23072/m.66893 type:complete len:103 (+) Transcript_23072:914-1222(+)